MKNIKTKTLLFVIFTVCLLVGGCQHNDADNPPSATETALWKATWDAVFATQTQMASVSSEATPEVLTVTPTPKITATPFYKKGIVELQCETYLETAWGNQAKQWGYSDDTARRFSLLPVVFKSEDEIYFSDYANLLLLKYNGIDKEPVQTISLASFFPEGYVYSWNDGSTYRPPISLISISQDKIYVPYGGNRIGILSLDGKIINDVVIHNHSYNFNLPTNNKFISVDKNGILYVQSSIQPVFFDNGWQSGNWVELLHTQGLINPFYWQDYIIVMGETINPDLISLISLYEIPKSEKSIEESQIVIPTGLDNSFLPLAGVDDNGNAYISIKSENPDERLYARYSIPTGEKQIASMPYPYFGQYTNLVPSVSPNGIMYFVAYNNEDLSIAPSIIKCNFPN
jgi:hypothetical protein